jgi:hypothetical protein
MQIPKTSSTATTKAARKSPSSFTGRAEDPRISNQPAYEQIASLAERLYIESGRQEGRDVENWLRAEQLISQQANGNG